MNVSVKEGAHGTYFESCMPALLQSMLAQWHVIHCCATPLPGGGAATNDVNGTQKYSLR